MPRQQSLPVYGLGFIAVPSLPYGCLICCSARPAKAQNSAPGFAGRLGQLIARRYGFWEAKGPPSGLPANTGRNKGGAKVTHQLV